MKKYIKLFIAALFIGFAVHAVYASRHATTSDLLLDNIKALKVTGEKTSPCLGCLPPLDPDNPEGCFCHQEYYENYDGNYLSNEKIGPDII